MKKIAILGSTGSIGTQTLEVVRENRDIEVTALAAGSNIGLLEAQIRKFHPVLAAVWDEAKAKELRENVKDLDVKVVSGMDGLIEVAVQQDAEILVTAIVGMIGILPTIEGIKAGKDIALANKETLVTAGHIIMPLAKEYGVSILPVDSEHSAIFQSLQGGQHKALHKILLTASGGPFRGKKREELLNIQVEDALKHPNWEMGRKITIDSSTMVNKGLEVIEAKWLFDVSVDQIQVVVQPQSIIHSMVEYVDGAVIAQLGTPDMKLPIQYALYYPKRRYLPGDRLDFETLSQITFERPDMETFYGLKLAYEAGKTGGSLPTVFNAANERAVAMFLNREIGYLQIPDKTLVEIDQIKNYPDDKVVLITTGSQGESMAALSRMAANIHKKVTIKPNDTIIFSSNPIPGNEKAVSKVINELSRKGADVIFQDAHVSGHACQEEIKLIYSLVKPKYAVPIHGEYRHLKAQAGIAAELGIPKENIFILSSGDVLELNEEEPAVVSQKVRTGAILVDGLGVGDVGNIVLRDRQHLAEDGIMIVVLTLEKYSSRLLAGPDIVSRGFVYVRESEDLMDEARIVVEDAIDICLDKHITDWGKIKNIIKDSLGEFLWKRTKRNPMILPIIMEA